MSTSAAISGDSTVRQSPLASTRVSPPHATQQHKKQSLASHRLEHHWGNNLSNNLLCWQVARPRLHVCWWPSGTPVLMDPPAITITAELFLAISPQRMCSICISLSSQLLSHNLDEFNYLLELKLCLTSFKLGSSFSISHEKVERQMSDAVQCANPASLGKWG